MIFNVPGHIEMIRNGLSNKYHSHVPQVAPTYPVKIIPEEVIKTQTRRLNRGIYQVGRNYAVQPKRGVRAEPDIRIVMDNIWSERCMYPTHPENIIQISGMHAWAEGGYTPEQYEKVFRDLNPKWNGWIRWAFKFHVIEIWTSDEKEIYRKFDGAQKELDREVQT